MASASYYYNQVQNNIIQHTLAEWLAELGGVVNPNQDNYTPAEKIDASDPTLRNIQEYLTELGAQDYQYRYEDILNTLNNASEAGFDVTKQGLANTAAEYYRQLADTQDTAADTIRQQYAQGIQSGISKGMQAANLLSTILGTTQAGAAGAQEQAQAEREAYLKYASELAGNGATALNQSNAAYETLMGNIRQLYNDEIQQQTAKLEYNASLEETLANYLATKYTADTNYSANQNSLAAGLLNQQQSSLTAILQAATAAEAQDNYSNAWLEGTKYVADKNYDAAISSSYTRPNYGSTSGNASSGASAQRSAVAAAKTASAQAAATAQKAAAGLTAAQSAAVQAAAQKVANSLRGMSTPVASTTKKHNTSGPGVTNHTLSRLTQSRL